MALKRLKDTFAPAVVGLALMAAPAYAEDAQEMHAYNTSIQNTSSYQMTGLARAGIFGDEAPENIAIVMVYGTGNTATPEQAGGYIERKLEELGASQDLAVNAEYFVDYTDKGEGMWVGYIMGKQSIDMMDVRDAIKPETFQLAIDKRVQANDLLAAADLDLSTN